MELKRNLPRSIFSMTVTCDCDALSRYVPGEFKKFNNNWDWAEDKRNTPQAFSHWTLQYSNGRALVCDIQGVGDVWTDPQFHTAVRLPPHSNRRLVTRLISTAATIMAKAIWIKKVLHASPTLAGHT